MSIKEEPSYMMFARANVRDNMNTVPSVVEALLNRIDRLEKDQQAVKEQALKAAAEAMRKEAAADATAGRTVAAWQNPPAWLEQYASEGK